MGFLDKVLKEVDKGVGRAQFEADKLVKVNNLRSEADKAKREERELMAGIGEKALALQASGQIALPGLEAEIAHIQDLRATAAQKELELAALQKQEFQAKVDEPAPISEPASPVMPARSESLPSVQGEPTQPVATAAPAFCPNCGARVGERAVFCAECGFRLG